MMVWTSISIDTNNVWIPLVGLETWQGNFISYEASGKASSAGYTCVDTKNSDRHPKDMAETFNFKLTAWKADREACQKPDDWTVAYGALSKACDAGYTQRLGYGSQKDVQAIRDCGTQSMQQAFSS